MDAASNNFNGIKETTNSQYMSPRRQASVNGMWFPMESVEKKDYQMSQQRSLSQCDIGTAGFEEYEFSRGGSKLPLIL